MDLISLAAAKNYANKVTAGFKSVQIEGMNLIFTLLDDSKATITLPAPANGKDGKNGLNGISVQNLSIDNDGSLLCHMSDGTTIDAGKVPMTEIELTDYYTKKETDNQNINSLDFYTVTGVNSLLSSGSTGLGNAASTIVANIRESAKRKRLAAFYDTTNYILWYPQYTLNSLANSATGLKLNYIGSGVGVSGLGGNSGSTQRGVGQAYLYVYVDIDGEGNITKSPDSKNPNIGMSSSQSYLSIWNTKAFTPTGDYHPATKKYVDDSIANIDIPETDLSNYYTKQETLNEIGNLNIGNYYTAAQTNASIQQMANNMIEMSGELTDLTTIDKSTFAAAINEVNAKTNVPRIYDMWTSLGVTSTSTTRYTDLEENIKNILNENIDRVCYLNIRSSNSNDIWFVPVLFSKASGMNLAKSFNGILMYGAGGLLAKKQMTITIQSADGKFTSVRVEGAGYDAITTSSYLTSNYYKKTEINSLIPTVPVHDGEGMIGWYNTATDGENLTSSYGVTPDMVRAVKAGDKISWPSRTRSGATENTICTYNMTYYVYNKDEMDDLETIDIMIGKVPDSTYTYVIVGDSVYKNTY